jgi:hypothetical protein
LLLDAPEAIVGVNVSSETSGSIGETRMAERESLPASVMYGMFSV